MTVVCISGNVRDDVCGYKLRANGKQAEAFKLALGSLPRGFDNLHNIVGIYRG